jgi:hypothetical protein
VNSIELSAKQLIASYHALRLECGGVKFGHYSAAPFLNSKSERSHSPLEWLAILEPHHNSLVNPSSL